MKEPGALGGSNGAGGSGYRTRATHFLASVRVGVVPQGRPKIAQHLSAGQVGLKTGKSRQGRQKREYGNSVVPNATCFAIAASPD